MAGSAELKERFIKRYNLDVNFEQAAERSMDVANRFRHLNHFLFENEQMSIEAERYLNTMMFMLTSAIDRRLAPESSGKEYYLSDIDPIEFIREYERVMRAEHEEKNPGTPRKANEGIGNKVLDRVEATMRLYEKPLHSVWADYIKMGEYKLDDLRRMTDEIYRESGAMSDDEETLQNPTAAATACEICRAMKQA